jgi:hypothetical protein
MESECWLEMDLYWFQGGSAQDKAAALFDRLGPIWQREPGARKGLTLCVGWLMDAVLLWNGEIAERIFTCRAPTYEAWTYARLAGVVSAVRREAVVRGIGDFHVGLMVFGGKGTVEGAPGRVRTEGHGGRTQEPSERAQYHHVGRWFHEHPEVYDKRFVQHFFWGAKVRVAAGDRLEGLAGAGGGGVDFAAYFAAKWGGFARAVGLDALVLRDHVLSPEYHRGMEPTRFKAPEAAEDWMRGLLELVSELKRQLPGMVLIGYSSGTSAMEDWRSHGFDLERLARSGHMDLWVTQTWASAWQDYWPFHAMGYTFQLSSVLTHAAMLADTGCKHLFLIEAFDAWEPWDTIHQYPDKLAWQVWAYSHAVVRLPGGKVRRAAGFYSSWMNRRDQLLEPSCVEWLVGTLNAAGVDLKSDPVPGGPCLVYSYDGLAGQMGRPGAYCRGEAFDDWTAMLQKYGLGMLSVTRAEWVGKIGEVDALVAPVSVGMAPEAAKEMVERGRRGVPVLWLGQAAELPEAVREALDIVVAEAPAESDLASGGVLMDEALCERFGTRGVVVNQRGRSLEAGDGWQSVIECLGGPVAARRTEGAVWIWETPEWGTLNETHLTVASVQSLQTYGAIAEGFGASGPGYGTLRMGWRSRQWMRPMCFLFWRYAEGAHGVLLGNLETGMTGNSQFYVHGRLSHACGVLHVSVVSQAQPVKLEVAEGQVVVALGPHGSCVLRLEAGAG